MADKPQTAADYLAQAAKLANVHTTPKPTTPLGGSVPFNKSTQAKQGTQDPLSWLVDIVTRPLSGVTNVAQASVDRSVDAQKAFRAGDVAGGIGKIAGNLLPAGDFLAGMFSSDPELHRTSSDVIEQTTDKAGSLDPNYVDVQDNVNPLLKGAAGLVGDIAFDPLTWIPGGQIAKAGGLAAKGAKLAITGSKGALDALSGASKAAKVVDDATEVAATAATKIARPTAEGAEAADVARAASDDPTFKATYDQHLADISKLDDESFTKAIDDRLRVDGYKELDRGLKTEQAAEMRNGLDALGPMTIQDIKRVPGVSAKTAKPVPFRTQAEVRGPDGTPISGWVEALAEAPLARLDFFGPQAQSVQNAARAALSGNKNALSKLEQVYTTNYLPAFAQAKQAGKIVGPFMREVTPSKGKIIKGEATVLDSLASFRQQLATSEEAVTERLGKPLTEALARFDNAANFDKAVSRIKGVMDQSIDVTTLRRLAPVDQAALAQMGVDPRLIPTGLKPFQAVANKTPLAPGSTLAEQIAKIGGEEQADSLAVEMASGSLDKAIFRDLDRKNLGKEYQHKTKTGTLRTEDQYGAGYGRNHREANTFFQYNLSKNVMDEVNRWATAIYKPKGKWIAGGARLASLKREKFMEALRLAERGLDQQGVPLTLGVGEKRIPISTSQVLDVIDSVDPKATLWAVHNFDTAVPWTNLSDAVYTAIAGGTPNDIAAMLRQVTTRHIAADGRVNELTNNMVKGGRFGRGVVLKGDDMIAKMTDIIDRSRPLFNHVIGGNAEALGARGIDETLTIADDVLSSLEAIKATPGGTGILLEAIADTGSRVTQVAKDLGMMKASRDTGEAIIDATVPLTDQVIAKGAVKASDFLRQIEAAEEAQVETAKVAQAVYEDTLKTDPFTAGGAVTDLGEKNAQQMGRGIFGKVRPIFSRRVGAERIYPKWMSSENALRTLTSHYYLRLGAIARSGAAPEEIANKLVNARNGVPTQDAETLELRDLWGQMFGNGERAGALVDNAFFRNGNNIHHLNEMLARTGLPEHIMFDVDAATKVAKTEGISVMEAAARQSAEWEITDAPDTLAKLYHAFVSMQAQQTIAQHFLKMSKDLGATRSVPTKGYALVGNDSGASIFAKYLPDSVYFQDDVLREMHVVDNMMQQTMDLSGPLGNFIREVYQPLQQAWKYGMTLPNPTHHVRNMVSDYSLTYYAQGIKGAKRANQAAFQALAAHDAYDGWSAVKALQGMEELPSAGKVVAEGKIGKLTADGLYAALSDRGNLMTFQHLEQLNEAAGGRGAGPLAKLWDTVQGSKVATKIGGVSEARDHFTRLQHAAQFVIQNIDNTKAYKSLDDLLDAASDATRKWHPDGTDMTRAEQYFRLVIPFYSWQRKAIPLIVESMLMHPGRVLSIPKAQYNIAVAMGVNPDSLANPFPDDQMFPSYMTDQITGPVAEIDGQYYGINPGFAANDVLNDWLGSNPARTALGSVSPLIRSPFEIAAGGQVGTGAHINDFSDYLDSQIPGLAQASRLSGTSITGSIVSGLQGHGLDPQYQIQKGNKDPVGGPALSALNWLTGAGISNMSAPNAINYAEIEKRNREGEQRAF